MNPFYEEVYALARQIPFGKVVSYSQIAWKLGQINGARASRSSDALEPSGCPCSSSRAGRWRLSWSLRQCAKSSTRR